MYSKYWSIIFNFWNHFVQRKIIYEGSLPKMRIWYTLLIKSDLKWCIHLSRSLFFYICESVVNLVGKNLKIKMQILLRFQCGRRVRGNPDDQGDSTLHGQDSMGAARHLQKLLSYWCGVLSFRYAGVFHEVWDLDIRWFPGKDWVFFI